MGWSTSLPVVSLSNKSFWISQKTSQQFEEKNFLDWMNDVQSISVLQYYENQKRKSSEKVTLFMCNQCDYHSVSKLDSFDHFIKNHVFLCTLCPFTGLTRSCVLKHCVESHEHDVNGKMKNIKAYNVNADCLVSELGASNKEFDSDLFDLQETKPSYYESDCSSDDGISNSSFLNKSHKEASDGGSGIQSKSGRNDDGERNKNGLVHFLDQTSSPRHRKPQHYENEYNELSDSNQLELFFSSDGDDNDPDLSESIFHDHKEMFMVSRLPFPIRQDDSPNEPMLNESNLSVDPPSILQSILQKDRLGSISGPSTSSAAFSCEKNSEVADVCQSISPGLSLPSSEILQKQLEATILRSSGISSIDTQKNDSEKKKAIPSLQTAVVKVEVMEENEAVHGNIPVTAADHGDENMVNNFLLSPVSDTKPVIDENNSSPQGDVSGKTEKYMLLRNLLKSNPQSNKYKQSKLSEIGEKTIKSPDHMPLTIRNASHMSLLQLLSTNIPFPLLDSKSDTVNKNSDTGSISYPTSLCVSKCNDYNLDFIHQNSSDKLVKRCKDEKRQNSSVQTIAWNRDSPQNNLPYLTNGQLKSSLITDKRTASKILSKISEYRTNTTNNVEASPTNTKLNHLTTKRKQLYSDTVSKLGLKYQRSKTLSSAAMKIPSKYKKKLNHQLVEVSSVRRDEDASLDRHGKRKAEHDDDYYPGSESSESSENSSADSFKHRKRSKRVRKHLFVRKPKIKMRVPVTLTPKRSLPTADTVIKNDENSRLSLSLSSSLSSTLSSSLSHTSVNETIIKEEDSSLLIENGPLEFKQTPDTECKEPSTALAIVESKLPPWSDKNTKEKDRLQHRPLSIDQISLSQHDRLKGSPNLLHHLLSELPVKTGTGKSSITDTDEIVRKTTCKKRSSSNSFTEGSINIELVSEVTNGADESPSDDGVKAHLNPKNESILSSVLSGNSDYGKRAFRNRSYSTTDSDHMNNASYCKNIKNHSSSSSRLSASMMDIPDPPATTFLSKNDFVLQSASLSTASLLSSSFQSTATINKPHKQELSNSKSSNSDTVLPCRTTLTSSSSSSPQSSSLHGFKSKAAENSLRNDDWSSSSLLRNLLTHPAKNVANTK